MTTKQHISKNILVNLTGPYTVNCTSKIIELLTSHSLNIKDMGQAVIHKSVNFSFLINVSSEFEMAMMLKDLVFGSAQLGLQVRFNVINEEQDLNHLEDESDNQFILTLLSKSLASKDLGPVVQALKEQGLEVMRINRLSEKPSLNTSASNDRLCIEFILEGKPKNLTDFRSNILEMLRYLDIDIAFQQSTPFRRNRRLVCFDMDSTLIEGEVIDELAKKAGVGEQVAIITKQAMQGEIDFNQSFERRVKLLKGLPESCLKSIADNLKLTEGAEKLVKTITALGYKTAILSGGFTYFGRIIQDRLGIDYMYANELDIKEGKVTGEIKSPIVNGERKAELLLSLTEKLCINRQQVIAVGDGANDLPMLDLAGLGIAFRAKPIVKEKAKHAISHLGLDGILYLMGVTDAESKDLINSHSHPTSSSSSASNS